MSTKKNAAETAAEQTYPAGVTQEQIDQWKAEYKVTELPTLRVKAADGSIAVAILKPLSDRNVMALALSNSAKYKIVEAGAVILQNCKLFIDPRIEQNDKMYVAACVLANQVADLPEAELGNL